MPDAFVSLNSWYQPGAILQAEEPLEIVQGGPNDWPALRDLLKRRQQKGGGDSPHPRSAAVGYITYEGAFRFSWFPQIEVIEEGQTSAAWAARRDRIETSPLPFCPTESQTNWRANQTRAEFETRVTRAQDYISAGDIYQVNLAQRLSTPFVWQSLTAFSNTCSHAAPRPAAPSSTSAIRAFSRRRLSFFCASAGDT